MNYVNRWLKAVLMVMSMMEWCILNLYAVYLNRTNLQDFMLDIFCSSLLMFLF